MMLFKHLRIFQRVAVVGGQEELVSSSGGAGGPDPERNPEQRGEENGFDLSNPVRSFVNTVRRVLFEPTGFFRALPPRGAARGPFVFALVCGLISFPLALLVASVDPQAGNGPGSERLFSGVLSVLSELGQPEIALGLLFLVILVPLGALASTILGLYITAGIQHLLVLLFVRPNDAGFETTFRIVAYASATLLLSWIPVVGLVVTLYGLYLTFVGIREKYETTNGRALAAISLPVALAGGSILTSVTSSFSLLLGV